MEQQTPIFGQGEYKFVYGKKQQYSLILWPLSFGDQMKVSDIVVKFVRGLADLYIPSEDGKQKGDMEIVSEAVTLIGENITKIVALAADLPENDKDIVALRDNITNMQLADLVNYIWEVNYGSVRKNYGGLISELKQVLTQAK